MKGLSLSLFARLLGRRADPADALRPLWHQMIAIARTPDWYARGGIQDDLSGRFDALSSVTALVMLRMEGDETLRAPSARLTELFVSDMDGQLRQSGVGDLMVGKRIAKLMSALGGRIEAFRVGLAEADDAALIAAIERNITLREGAADPAWLAAQLRNLAARLSALDNAALLGGKIAG